MEKQYLTLAIAEIKEYKLNNKKHPQEQIDVIKKSIEETGYIGPIIVDETNTILAGHGRLKALKQLKWKDVEVIKVEGLSEEQKKKYRILDNRTSDLSEYDLDNLNVDLKSLSDTSLDNLFEGFDFSNLSGQNTTNNMEFYEDNVEEVPEGEDIEAMLDEIETPDVEGNTVRGLLIPVNQEIYEKTKAEFLLAVRNGVDVGALLLNVLQNENSESLKD